MAVNLLKYKEEMLQAWNEVVDDKCETNWALFGYDKQSDDLKLVGTGEDGLEELAEDFNSGKMMYAFCKVIDSKTSLTKFVLINWQGEGAPIIRKGNCAHHIHDIKKFFKGAHITINARTEDEVDPDVIMEKVSKSTGSSYTFSDRSNVESSPKPVASVYKRVQPTSEINPQARDKFWEQQEMEEKKRVAEEQKKVNETRKMQEKERKERELKEAEARENVVRERSRSINEIRKAEKLAAESQSSKVSDKQKWDLQLQEDMKEENLRRKRSESLRQERNQETQQLIGQRTIDARAIFEQNTSAGQMVTRKNSGFRRNSESATQLPPEINTVRNDFPIKDTSSSLPSSTDFQVQNTTPKADDTSTAKTPETFSYTRNLLKDGLPPQPESDVDQEEDNNWEEPPLEDPPKFVSPLDIVQNETSGENINTLVHQAEGSIPQNSDEKISDIKARALYDYQAADDTEISFDPDDIITNIDKIDEGWWQGIGPDGSFGLFPANYVELIS